MTRTRKISHQDVVDLWPSATELAADLGQKESTVRKWRERNSIPAWHWMAIKEAADKRGLRVGIDDLARTARGHDKKAS